MDKKYIAKYQIGRFKTKCDMYGRIGAPARNVSFREISLGVIIDYTGWIENGELFKGISKWYFDKDENFYWAGNCEEVELSKLIDGNLHVEIEKNENKKNKHPLKLINKQYYGHKSPETIAIRDHINDLFGQRKNGSDLQCTEYTYYRVLCSGHKIEWKRTSGRDGGSWPEAVSDKYKRLDTPVVGGTISIPKNILPPYGYVSYVEKVNADLSINISEANWGPNNKDLGHYWERTLSMLGRKGWKDHYKAKFIDFNL